MMHLAVSHEHPGPATRHAGAGGQNGARIDARDAALLDLLRARAINTQLAPRVEPFAFCALIEAAPDRAVEAYVDGLLHVLPKALERPVIVRRPGAANASFDETWLIGAIAAARRGDRASLDFAVASRAPRAFRRPLAFLIDGIARRVADAGLSAG